jgi:hypothetical protein
MIDDLARIVAESRIRDTVARFARAVDRRDTQLIRDCFHHDARLHYGTFDGPLEEYIPFVLADLARSSQTMHFMGASIIDWLDPANSAQVETYATVICHLAGGEQRANWVGGIRYLDRFEARGNDASNTTWRIAERTVLGDWLRIDPIDGLRRFHPSIPAGSPGPNDMLFNFLAQTSTAPGAPGPTD